MDISRFFCCYYFKGVSHSNSDSLLVSVVLSIPRYLARAEHWGVAATAHEEQFSAHQCNALHSEKDRRLELKTKLLCNAIALNLGLGSVGMATLELKGVNASSKTQFHQT